MLGGLKVIHSYALHLGGAREHVPRTTHVVEERGLQDPVWFPWSFLTSSQKSPHMISSIDHVPTVSDSAYVAGIETALISSLCSVAFPFRQELQHLVKANTHPLFITHAHARSNIPAFIAEENK